MGVGEAEGGGGIWVFGFILGIGPSLVAPRWAEETQTAADYGSLGTKTRRNEAFCSLSSAKLQSALINYTAAPHKEVPAGEAC